MIVIIYDLQYLIGLHGISQVHTEEFPGFGSRNLKSRIGVDFKVKKIETHFKDTMKIQFEMQNERDLYLKDNIQ